MKKTILCILALAMFVFFSYPALAEPWKVTIEDSLMVTQNAYTKNWAGSESGSLSWTANSNTLAEKQITLKMNSRNTVKLSYGLTYVQDTITNKWGAPVKSTDLIDAESILRFTLHKFVDPYTSLRFESQFYDSSDPAKTRYINPTTFTESGGVAKELIKKDKREWLTRLGLALKQKTDRDRLDPATLERQNKTQSSGGIEFISNFTSPYSENKITYTNNLTVYQALANSEANSLSGLPNEDYWRAVDVNWEHILSVSISRYVMVNFYAQWLYDKEIALGGRFKETLALGVTYKLSY
ncbi:MAG: DUF3078 domain-containing protein [bacterium]|nr:DUF3078 domain-containing protein [bacterium]MDD5353836.1 DUF3078 domain-containing protein [bacterium]MDD5756708.1 DUF3078 domain-containing protein [bacterium]